MKKRIERKEERIAAIRSEAARHRGVYAEVARENGWGRDYVCSVMAGRNSSENVLFALEKKTSPEYSEYETNIVNRRSIIIHNFLTD